MQDIRVAFRQFRKAPGFAITVILTIALGIGANTAIFTLVHAVLLKSLPVGDPKTLYRIGDHDDCCVEGGYMSDKGDFDIFSYELYKQFRKTSPEFEQLAAMQAGSNRVSTRRGSEPAKPGVSEYVSGNYFSTFGVGAFAGRVLSDDDDKEGATPVVVMSYQTWRTDYGSDPTVVGTTIYFQAQPVTVVGIAPPAFYGDRINSDPPAFWVPLSIEPVIERGNTLLHVPGASWLYAVGRVKPGVNIDSLQAKLTNTLQQWLATVDTYSQNGAGVLIPKQHVVMSPAGGGIQNMQQESRDGLFLLMAISGPPTETAKSSGICGSCLKKST